jgi:hypothetical protein
VPEELEAWIIAKVGDVFLAPGEQIVDAQDVTALLQKPIDQVGSEEPRSPRHHHALAQVI